MRIAIQLFGNLRTADRCIPVLTERFGKHAHIDYFVHTWTRRDHSSPTWHSKEHHLEAEDFDAEALIRKLLPGACYQVDEPLSREEDPNPADPSITPVPHLEGLKSMFTSMARVNRLRQNYESSKSISYDLVVCLRPDIELLAEVDLEGFLRFHQDVPWSVSHLIHSVDLRVAGNQLLPLARMADVFFVGLPQAMDYLSSIDSFIELENSAFATAFPSNTFVPEQVFLYFLARNGLVSFYFHQETAIRRMDPSNDIVAQKWHKLPPLSMESPILRAALRLKRVLIG